MNDQDPRGFDTLSRSDFERVLEACDRFEAAWKSGQRPAIELFLTESSDRERSGLLLELLEHELELRRKAGEQPTRAEYYGRFPGREELIDKVFTRRDPAATTLPELSQWLFEPLTSERERERDRGRRVGDYELLEEIATGGMGVVYRARQVSLDRLVALKMILMGRFASDKEVRRFRCEARSAACLKHPGIVPIHDLGLDEGRHFIVMDLVEGPSLERRVAHGPLEQREAARLVQRIAEAIQFAHDRGIIHRDLKPANVLLDGQGQPLITDFGLAKRTQADGQVTVTGQAIGTPSYMPPEQARGGAEIGPACDIYALGATLYCLVTGRPPFQAATAVETLRLVVETEPVPPRRLNFGLDRDLEIICLKCLHKEPARRYPRADALAHDLGRYLAAEPIAARPVGAIEKLSLWSRKNRGLAGMTAAVLVLTVMMIAGSVLYTLRISAALEDVRHKLVRQYVLNGTRSLEDGDNLGALPWFAKALQLDEGDPRKERIHRLRIRSVLSSCPKLVEFRRIGGAFDPALVSRDGRRAIEFGGAEARVRDTASGRPVTPPLRHAAAVKRAAFSPDGRRVATVSADRAARVWDAATGAALTPALPHKDDVNDLAFSPDGRFLLTAVGGPQRGPIGEAVLWDLATATAAIPPLKHGDDVYCARFSPDGRRIVTTSYDGTARVWDATTGAPLSPPLLHPRSVTLAVFDPTGSRVVTVSREEARVWDALSGAPTTPPLRHRGPILQVVFAPDGSRFATETHDRRVRLWDAATGDPLGAALPANGESLVSFAADGRQLIIDTTRGDRSHRIWDAATETPRVVTMDHRHSVVCAFYSADGRRVLTASLDRSWRIWDASDGRPLTPPVLQGEMIQSAAFSPDDRLVVTGGRDHTARVWDAATGQPVSAPLKHDGDIMHVAFSPDGRRVLTASADGTARVWDAASGKPLTPPLKHGSMVLHAVFHPDGQRIATASRDGTALVWDLATGRPSGRPLKHGERVLHLAFSRDGRRLLSSSRDGTARLWDVPSAIEVTPPLRHDGAVTYAAFSGDGRRVVTTSDDRTARIWDATTGAPITPPLKHPDRVNWAIFDPEGLFVLSGSGGPESRAGEVRMWDAATGDAVLLPLKHVDDVNTVALSPDGRHILSASFDQTARIWPVLSEDRPVAEILSLAGLLSGSRVDETGGLVPLTLDELTAVWNQLRAAYPESLACPASDVLAWHEREALTCERRTNWAGANLHLSRLIAARSAAPDLFARRAEARAELGAWSEAADDFRRAIELGSDRPGVWGHYALVPLAQGDIPGYRRVRAAMLDRFLDSKDAGTKIQVAWTCAVCDDPEGWPAEALRMAREAAATKPPNDDYIDTLGTVLYRAGRYDEAVLKLGEAIELHDGEGTARQFLFLAMAQGRLHCADSAREFLEKADRKWAEVSSPHPGPSAPPSPIRWHNRLLFQYLRQEAIAILDSM
jgi:WD40 repeat protein/tetratricopeptide (TPR) repeat protein/predicted Ser/Thr protein kinase